MLRTLNEDVVALIMQFAAPDNLLKKFELVGVCPLWRRAALRHCPLWASFSAWTTLDYRALPLALSRSGTIYLDIELGYEAREVAPQYLAAVDMLQPLFPRLRRLVLQCTRPWKLPVFFGHGLELPALEHLELGGEFEPGADGWLDVHLVTPALRTFVLEELALRVSWIDLLSPTLERIFIDSRELTQDLATLVQILSACPVLQELRFSLSGDPRSQHKILDPLSRVLRRRVSTLHTLELRLPSQEHHTVVQLLRVMFDAGMIPLHLRLADMDHDAFEPIAVELLRPADPVVQLRAMYSHSPTHSEAKFFMETASGHTRDITIYNLPHTWRSPLHVMQLHVARRLLLDLTALDLVVRQDFTWPALDLLRIHGDLSRTLRTDWSLVCLDVSRIVVGFTGQPARVRNAVLDVMGCVTRRARGRRPTVVCLAGSRLAQDENEHAKARELLRGRIGRYGGGSWVMCTDCCALPKSAKRVLTVRTRTVVPFRP